MHQATTQPFFQVLTLCIPFGSFCTRKYILYNADLPTSYVLFMLRPTSICKGEGVQRLFSLELTVKRSRRTRDIMTPHGVTYKIHKLLNTAILYHSQVISGWFKQTGWKRKPTKHFSMNAELRNAELIQFDWVLLLERAYYSLMLWYSRSFVDQKTFDYRRFSILMWIHLFLKNAFLFGGYFLDVRILFPYGWQFLDASFMDLRSRRM